MIQKLQGNNIRVRVNELNAQVSQKVKNTVIQEGHQIDGLHSSNDIQKYREQECSLIYLKRKPLPLKSPLPSFHISSYLLHSINSTLHMMELIFHTLF